MDGGTKCSPYAAALMFKGSPPFYMDEVGLVLFNLHLIDVSLVSKHFKIAAFKKNTFSFQFLFGIRFILACRIIFSFSHLCFLLAVIWQLCNCSSHSTICTYMFATTRVFARAALHTCCYQLDTKIELQQMR